jgi:hypothetical protein
MAGAAVLAERDFGDAADGTGFDLRQPQPAVRDRRDKPRSVVRSDRLAGSSSALVGREVAWSTEQSGWPGMRHRADSRLRCGCPIQALALPNLRPSRRQPRQEITAAPASGESLAPRPLAAPTATVQRARRISFTTRRRGAGDAVDGRIPADSISPPARRRRRGGRDSGGTASEPD